MLINSFMNILCLSIVLLNIGIQLEFVECMTLISHIRADIFTYFSCVVYKYNLYVLFLINVLKHDKMRMLNVQPEDQFTR